MWIAHKSRKLFVVVREFVMAVSDHQLFMHAAACAYFLFLALPPSLLALVSVVGLVPFDRWTEATELQVFEWCEGALAWAYEGEEAGAMSLGLALKLKPIFDGMQGLSIERLAFHLREALEGNLPQDMAESVAGIVEGVADHPLPGLLTYSFLALLWSASGATRSAMRAMSVIYEVKLRFWLLRNLVSLGLTVGVLISWIVVLALIPLSSSLAHLTVSHLGLDQGILMLWKGINWGLGGSLLFGTVLFFNRFGPDVPLRLPALVPGSLLTVGLWFGMTQVVVRWVGLNWQTFNATYGAPAVVLILLVWCYLLSIGLMLGAELNTAILRLRRSGLEGAGTGDLHESIRTAVEEQIETIPILEESVRMPAASPPPKQ